MTQAGIYVLENLLNGNIYVGSSKNLNRRKAQHLWALRSDYHHNLHLQSAFNKYGEENFVYRVLIICDVENLLFFEQLLLDKYNPQYNKREIAESNYGYKHSKEARKNMSDAHIGNKNPHNKEWREKMSKIHKGRIISMETRKKISDAHLAISSEKKLMWKDENRRKKHSEIIKLTWEDENRRKIQSENMKLIWEKRRNGILPMPKRKVNYEHV